MKEFLLSIYNFGFLSKKKANKYQLIARKAEWVAIKDFISINETFLDVGCGAGYSMKMAKDDCNCEIFGIDPDPMAHGVGREGSKYNVGIENITKGVSEQIPFEDNKFDVVYSSHVLEHVQSEERSLQEMKRVIKDDGVLILGVPTATMAYINWVTQLLFTTHIKIAALLLHRIFNTGKYRWWEIFIPVSHSFSTKSLLYDIKHYKVKNWSGIISKEFNITHVILPALYPYPEYRQLFRLRKTRYFSSSVFFICKKC